MPTTLSVAPVTVELSAFGETLQFTAEVRDQSGRVMTGVAVTWTSSNAGIATVNAAGLVTAAGNGAATISAAVGSASGSASVTVVQRVQAVDVSPEADTLVTGESLQMDAKARDANDHEVATAEIRWTSNDTSVVTVDSAGLATAIGTGEAVVTAASSGITGDAALRVVAPAPTTVRVTPEATTLPALGDTVRLAATVHDQIGRPMPNEPVTWSSADESVATVDSVGLVRAEGPGATRVDATAGTASGNSAVSVMQTIGSVVVLPPADTIAPADTLRLSAEAFDENGHPVTDAVFTWSSSNTAVVHVDDSGLVRGRAEGAATVTATAGSVPGTSEITVVNPDRAALVALHQSAGGPAWTSTRNWLTDAPLADWDGVRVQGSRVTRLSLNLNNLRGPLPPEIGDLSKLTHLSLSGNALTGSIPPEVGKLQDLVVLNLHANDLSGPIPAELGSVSKLESVNLKLNALTGLIPPALGNLAGLTELNLFDNRLSGPIPPELGSLVSLVELSLAGNDLTGPLPATLGRLANLEILTLAGTRVDGPIPPEFGGLASLRKLTLRANNLSGPIPPELGQLSQLDLLDLGENNLTGSLPPTLGGLSLLKSTNLTRNRLTGPIPRDLLRLGSLTSFRFSFNAGLCAPGTADFESWLNGMFRRGPFCNESDRAVLESIYAADGGADWARSDGWLGGIAIGEWYGVEADSLGRVRTLDLSRNGLTGRLPQNLGRLTEMTGLRLGGNALSGRLPLSLAALPLRELSYVGTELCTPVDEAFREWLRAVQSHDGTGLECGPPSERDILSAVYDATSGHEWTRSDNWLTDAPLRDWYGVAADGEGRVTVLELGDNGLKGIIPPELGDLSRLERLVLHNNDLTGGIPPEIGNLSNLEFVRIFRSGLTGAIPPEIGQLSNLRWLEFGSNSLTGPIPPEIGDAYSLEWLDLGSNALTGPIPPKLGDLSNLRRLDLSGNALGGSIPPELGDLSELHTVYLFENRLTGPIPPEFGGLSAVTSLRLEGNQLTGPVPAELARLASLRELSLANNPGLSGVLPGALVGLHALQSLRAGGTEVCAPSDASFRSWLDGLRDWRLATCALASVYLTQAVQSREFPVPLVAGEEALLRVFVTSARASGEGIPQVLARFYLGDRETFVADIPVQTAPMPAEIDESSLRASANALIPGDMVKPGLQVVVEVDPNQTLAPDLGVTRRIPETGRLEIDVRTMPTLDLTFVPFIWSETPDSAIVDMVRGMVEDPGGHELLSDVRTLLPVAAIDAKAHEPVVTSTTTARDLLRETIAIRTMEGASGHYMGMLSGRSRGYAGLAQLRGRVSFARPNPSTLAHELGHNMGLQHAPCGAMNTLDPSFPHPRGAIGAWGFDFGDGGGLVAPHSNDLMSYCRPGWISDYHFSNALNYRRFDEVEADAVDATARTKTLLLWGGVDDNGVLFLEPALVVSASPTLPEQGGDHVIAGRTTSGDELFSFSFDMPVLADGEGSSSFVFALPVRPGWGASLADITLSGPGGSFTLDRETKLPVVILRDDDTGEVRAILRDLTQADLARGVVRDVTLEAGFEARFSRGIPDLEEWRR